MYGSVFDGLHCQMLTELSAGQNKQECICEQILSQNKLGVQVPLFSTDNAFVSYGAIDK